MQLSKEEIIEILNKSFSEYKGSNEAIDDASFYIAAEFEKQALRSQRLEKALEVLIGHAKECQSRYGILGDAVIETGEEALVEYGNNLK